MSVWTINNVEFGDIGVDTAVISIANQDEDYAEIKLATNYDAALPEMFAIGAQVVIRYGTKIIFQGEVDNPSFVGNHSLECQSVFVFGPWHRFAQMPFLYNYPYVTGAALSTHGVIGGAANSLLTTILSTNAGDFFQVGTIDVGTLTIPESEVYDQTLSQTLQSILRFIPGAQVIFDYSTTPPTCHILADNSASLQTVAIDPADGLTSGFNLKPLYNRLADGVTLQYEASGTTVLGEQIRNQDGPTVDTISSPATSSGFFIVGTDSAGDAASRRHFRRTIRLEGVYNYSVYRLSGQLWTYVPRRSVRGGPFTLEDFMFFGAESGDTTNNKSLMVDRAMFFRMMYNAAHNYYFDLSLSSRASAQNAGALSWASTNWLSDASTGYYSRHMRPLMRNGGTLATTPSLISDMVFAKWPAAELSTVFMAGTGSGALKAFGASVNWSFTNTSGNAGYADQSSGTGSQIVFIDVRTLGSVDSSTGRFDYVVSLSNSSTEIPASGIAAQILEANSRLLWEGGCSILLEDDPTRFFGLARKATISALSASTVIQRFTLDVTTGLCDLTFGAPTHLGPQDLITLLRAGGSA